MYAPDVTWWTWARGQGVSGKLLNDDHVGVDALDT